MFLNEKSSIYGKTAKRHFIVYLYLHDYIVLYIVYVCDFSKIKIKIDLYYTI